ncbi:MAG: GGDEF domain-containing protein [Burkholderiaceae bacterium]|nr:GGDEF domain-containing protein [Burkholderiaceae bacterium]
MLMFAATGVPAAASTPTASAPAATATAATRDAHTLAARLDEIERLAARDPQAALRGIAQIDTAALSAPQQLRLAAMQASALASHYDLPAALKIADAHLPQARARDERRLIAVFLGVRALALMQQKQGAAAAAAAEEAVAVADRSGVVEDRVSNRTLLALVASARRDYQRAYAVVEEADQLGRGARDPAILGHIATASGRLAREIGDVQTAMQSYAEAEAAFAADGDQLGEADAARERAALLIGAGRHAEAGAPVRRALAIFEAIADPFGLSSTRSLQAQILAASGRVADARAMHAQALASMRTLDDSVALADQLVVGIELLTRERDAAAALPLIEEVGPLLARSDDVLVAVRFHHARADAYAQLGRYREAHAAMQAMVTLKSGYDDERLSRQLAAQRGRLETRRLAGDLARTRDEAQRQRSELAAAERRAQLQTALVLLALLAAAAASWALARSMRRNRRSTRLAHTDYLTGVRNRRRISELGQSMLRRCQADGRPFSVLLIDIDRFKAINDDFGHQAGDRALQAVAAELQRHLREGDKLGRYGGEEFTVVLPDAPLAQAVQVAERLRQAVGALEGGAIGIDRRITVSVGVAAASDDESRFGVLIARADRALYAAKESGRNRVVQDDPASPPPSSADVAPMPTRTVAPVVPPLRGAQ